MSHNPKLEIYQIILNPVNDTEKTFRDFFESSLVDDNSLENTSGDKLFKEFFKKFISKIDTDEFIKNKSKKKAFAAYDTNTDSQIKPSISFDSNRNIIEGIIEGGKYGQVRNKSSIDNKKKKENLLKDDIILDKFYFCLYTPLSYDIGILFVQSYSTDNITDIFKEFIGSLFLKLGSYNKPRVLRFIPSKIIEEFKNHSIVKRFSFNSRFFFSHYDENPIDYNKEEFIIKIEAISKNGLPKDSFKGWLKSICLNRFNDKPLDDFKKGTAYLYDKKSKKESAFDINSDLDIKPIIYLEDKISVDNDGLPDFIELKKYCLNLLEKEIIPQINPIHAIKDH